MNTVSLKDRELIKQCVARAKTRCPTIESGGLLMDMWAVHSVLPLNLDGLLASNDGDFSHDIIGIHNHYDRETKRLLHSYSPRFVNNRSVAVFIANVTVQNPCSKTAEKIAIYKDMASGAFFGVDCDCLMTLSDDDQVFNPFNGEAIHLIDEEIDMAYSKTMDDLVVTGRNSCE